MPKNYYSSRKKKTKISLTELYWKFKNLYLFFRKKDYFKEKTGITDTYHPVEELNYQAALLINFNLFPITKWKSEDITEEHIFDAIEFLHDYVSKPGAIEDLTSETNFNYRDYGSYDKNVGQSEFRQYVNIFLCDYKKGFELSKDGTIISFDNDPLQDIFDAKLIKYDEKNVDSKVRSAIKKWRNRHSNIKERKSAIQEMADVFEWLKKTKKLKKVLNTKDESALFDIANNFAIRHHTPNQKTDYDKPIWYSWIFHFYLATYHAVISVVYQ